MIKKFMAPARYISMMLALAVIAPSCTDDLERVPTNGITNEIQFKDLAGYKQAMATVYSQLSAGYFLRNYFNMQEVTTDEAVATWDDPAGLRTFNTMDWNADNGAVSAFYGMVMYNITVANNFLMESTPETVARRGLSEADQTEVKQYVNEMRFLRAYYYWLMLDLYGNPPFATETNLITGNAPEQISQAELFDFIESELLACQDGLAEPRTNEYGRADKGAAWALLARLYLNAETYTETGHYTEAATFSKRVIDAGYSLEQQYGWLLLGDNHLNTNEFIFTANYNNSNFTTFGGTNYIALGASNVPRAINGLSDSWTFLRVRPQFANLFPTFDTTVDKRAQFWTGSNTLEIDNLSNSSAGYAMTKYRNLTRNGDVIPQENVYSNISDIDFPIFRLAEMYLIYAEATLRGGSGDRTLALGYINKIRGRAYANNPDSSLGNIASSDLTLDFIIDERARELYWECFRRTDLIRFDRYTSGSYLWSWKGGVQEGAATNARYELFPLPTSDVLANRNLEQNTGY